MKVCNHKLSKTSVVILLLSLSRKMKERVSKVNYFILFKEKLLGGDNRCVPSVRLFEELNFIWIYLRQVYRDIDKGIEVGMDCPMELVVVGTICFLADG